MFKFEIIRMIQNAVQKKKALSLTVGFYLAIFPVLGTTTVLCLLASMAFRLNIYLVQAMNFLLWPVQLLLVYPFLKAGRILFFEERQVMPNVAVGQWLEAKNPEQLLYLFESVIGGITVWSLFSISTGYFLYRFLLSVLPDNKE